VYSTQQTISPTVLIATSHTTCQQPHRLCQLCQGPSVAYVFMQLRAPDRVTLVSDMCEGGWLEASLNASRTHGGTGSVHSLQSNTQGYSQGIPSWLQLPATWLVAMQQSAMEWPLGGLLNLSRCRPRQWCMPMAQDCLTVLPSCLSDHPDQHSLKIQNVPCIHDSWWHQQSVSRNAR
jgi:hypothetical protein